MYDCQLRPSHVAEPKNSNHYAFWFRCLSRLTQLSLPLFFVHARVQVWSSELSKGLGLSWQDSQALFSLSPSAKWPLETFSAHSLMNLLWNTHQQHRAHCLQPWSAAPAFSRDRLLASEIPPHQKNNLSAIVVVGFHSYNRLESGFQIYAWPWLPWWFTTLYCMHERRRGSPSHPRITSFFSGGNNLIRLEFAGPFPSIVAIPLTSHWSIVTPYPKNTERGTFRTSPREQE